MSIDLDRLEQRIVGVLIEKETTVPDTYPLSVNALVAGCNQKNNRDPEMSVEDYEVEGALRALMDRGWVHQMDKAGGRTLRYAHRAGEQLGVDRADLALLAELLLRGPQAPGALKTRASRMHPFADPAAVEARLEALAGRPVPYVRRLARQPREHAPRWTHLLGPSSHPEGEGESAGEAEVRPAARSHAPWGDDDLRARIEALEARVAELEERAS